MFIDVVAMHMVQMPIMQVINMSTVADGRMAAIGSVDVWVVAVLRIGASCHDSLRPLVRKSQDWLGSSVSSLSRRLTRISPAEFLG
jgi:hypothetical protein